MYAHKIGTQYFLNDRETTRLMFHQFVFSLCIDPPEAHEWAQVYKTYKTGCKDTLLFYGNPPPNGNPACFLQEQRPFITVFIRLDPVEYYHISFSGTLFEVVANLCPQFNTVYVNGIIQKTDRKIDTDIYFITIDTPFHITITCRGKITTHYLENLDSIQGKIVEHETTGINIYITVIGLSRGIPKQPIASTSHSLWYYEQERPSRVIFYDDMENIKAQCTNVIHLPVAGK